MGDAVQPAQRNVYDPIKKHNANGVILTPRSGTVVENAGTSKGKKWNAMDAYGPNAQRRHRGYAPSSGDLSHLPVKPPIVSFALRPSLPHKCLELQIGLTRSLQGNQPHHYVFTPPFKDIHPGERYDRSSSRIGTSKRDLIGR